MSIKDMHVIVAGGAGALGSVIADALLEGGAAVTVMDLNEHARAYSLPCDLTDAEYTDMCVDEARRRSGPVGGLVLCAGAFAQNPAEALRANYLTAYHPLRSVLPGMEERGEGSIVALTSDYALSSVPGVTAYAAAKAAVNGLMREAAQHCAHTAVRVNALLLGVNAWEDGLPGAGGIPRERLQLIAAPFTPRLCADTVLFLLSAQSAGITGQQWRMDGGMQAFAHAPMLLE